MEVCRKNLDWPILAHMHSLWRQFSITLASLSFHSILMNCGLLYALWLWKPRFIFNWDDFQRKIRPLETVARKEFLVSEVLRSNKLRIHLWNALKISRTKFLTENLTRNCKNFCEKGHWWSISYLLTWAQSSRDLEFFWLLVVCLSICMSIHPTLKPCVCILFTFSSCLPEPLSQFQPILHKSSCGKKGCKFFSKMKNRALFQGTIIMK